MIASWHIIPFSLAWSIPVSFFVVLAIKAKTIIGWPFVTPFILFSLYLLFGRFWTWTKYWRNTFYLVTNKRIIITAGAFRLCALSWNFSEIEFIALQRKRSGMGHINFVKSHIFSASHPFNVFMILPTWTISRGLNAIAPSFRYIKEPEKVYQIIQMAKEGYRPNPDV